MDNICIRWKDLNTHPIGLKLTDTVRRVVSALVVPSKIKHIEILLSWSSIVFRGNLVKLDRLEGYALDLHRSGSLERLTITVESDALSHKSVSEGLPVLSSLGLLDVRIRQPSLLYPRCTKFSIGSEGY